MSVDLHKIARMAADIAAINEYGPEARIEDFRVDSVEINDAVSVSRDEDGVYVVEPTAITDVRASCRLMPDAQTVEIRIEPVG